MEPSRKQEYKKVEGIVALFNYFSVVIMPGPAPQNSVRGLGAASPPCLKERRSWHFFWTDNPCFPSSYFSVKRSNSQLSGSNCTHNNSMLAATVKKGKFTPLQLNILF